MKVNVTDKDVIVFAIKRVDTNNSYEFERELLQTIEKNQDKRLILDCSEMNYISSAGLRVLLKIKKNQGQMVLENVSKDVYEVLLVTGFTQIMTVKRKLSEISIDNAELLGAGANGRVYRLDQERIVKVFNSTSNPPEKISREQESARQAFIHGIPSAIPFEIVRVGDELGMIYELITARTLGSMVHSDPKKLEKYAIEMSALMKKLHSTKMDEGTMPDARLALRLWADIASKSDFYSRDDMQRIYELIDSVPVRETFIHGDFHPGNIMVSEGELILIDMGDASVGHPVIDLLGTYQLMSLAPKKNAGAAMRYLGMTAEESVRMWDVFIRDYLGTEDENIITKTEESLKSLSLIRTLGGIVFSDVIPDDKRRFYSAMAMKDILDNIEKTDYIINAL